MKRIIVLPAVLLLLLTILFSLPVMAQVSFVNQCTGTTSCASVPAHQAGDLFIAYAGKDASSTAITLPSGWTSSTSAPTMTAGINGTSSADSAARLYCKVAVGSSETVTGFTTATSLVVLIYRGAAAASTATCNTVALGTISFFTSTINTTSVTETFNTVTNAKATSWDVGFGYAPAATAGIGTAPAGMTNRASGGTIIGGHDTNAAVASYSTANVTLTTAGRIIAGVAEILAPTCDAPTITISPAASSTNDVTFTVANGGSACASPTFLYCADTTGTCTPATPYTGAVTVSTTATVPRAKAQKTGANDSAITTGATITLTTATPVASPPTENFTGTITVGLTTATTSITSIRYTTDGSAPSCPSTGTAYSGLISVSATTTIKSVACKTNYATGTAQSDVYTLQAPTSHYVNCNSTAGGDGSTLAAAGATRAFAALPTTLVRGDTYYVAGDPTCTYPAHTFDDAESGTNVIAVYKVTAAQSAVTGYASSMSSSAAKWIVASNPSPLTVVLPIWGICRSYYTIDGITGTTDPVAGPSGQGFVVSASGQLAAGYVNLGTNGCGAAGAVTLTNISLHHIEVKTNASDTYRSVAVTGCSYAGGVATITAVPGWSQGWVSGNTVSGSPDGSGALVFTSTALASPSGNNFNVTLASSPCATLKWVQLDTGGGSAGGTAIYAAYFGGPASYSNLDIQYNYLHPSGFDTIAYLNANGQGSGSTIAHNYLAGNFGFSGAHGQPIQSSATNGLTVAYNVFADPMGTAIFFNNAFGSTVGKSDNLAFYGNLVFETGTLNNQLVGVSAMLEDYLNGAANCTTGGSAPITSMVVYNNTFANLISPIYDIGSGIVATPGTCARAWTVKNNLWWKAANANMNYAAITSDYNTIAQGAATWAGGAQGANDFTYASGCASGPFVSVAANNYNLSAETVAGCAHLNDGVTLSAPYNVDMAGTTRGSDGTWERGTYQFSAPSVSLTCTNPLCSGTPVTAIAFGTQTTASPSEAVTVTLTNSGNLILTGISEAVTGTNAADFVIGSNTCTATLTAGASCTLTVTFTPSVANARSATLGYTSSAATSPNNISLTGTGSGPPSTLASLDANGRAEISVCRGQSATLNYTDSGGTALTASIDNGIGAVGASGASVVSPTATTTYTITASSSTGSASASVTIHVARCGGPF